ncbi:MAG: AAA-like domain-containing protein [Verrucomicrobia bacterium]|nr:AAA-like domain-containing protein [Verrucomicrobiota bacterium]
MDSSFFVTGGTLRHDAPSYVERQADKDLLTGLLSGEFCYVLTSRQMGKSSLMIRTANRLREEKVRVAILDLTAIGQNLTSEQWYDGLLSRLGRQLDLEDDLEDYWLSQHRVSPVQRFISAIRDVVLPRDATPVVVFVDEIDGVRSLPFATDEFFAAIRECYNRRVQDSEFNRLTFCLLGVATPAELIRDPRTTPFNIGNRVELIDFTHREASPFAERLGGDPAVAKAVFERIYYWTRGHPYLTQRFCRSVMEEGKKETRAVGVESFETWVDSRCEELYLSPRAREQDDNLLFVRERLLRTEADLTNLLELYQKVRQGDRVPDDEANDLINQLRLAGIVSVESGVLVVRNQIYERVFDENWVAASLPDAELEKPDGQRIRIHQSCSMGRASGNDVVLPDQKISRRHSLIQAQKQQEFWLMDLGSSNGTYVNGRRLTQPTMLQDKDRIEIGPFQMIFHQSGFVPVPPAGDQTTFDQTVFLQQESDTQRQRRSQSGTSLSGLGGSLKVPRD